MALAGSSSPNRNRNGRLPLQHPKLLLLRVGQPRRTRTSSTRPTCPLSRWLSTTQSNKFAPSTSSPTSSHSTAHPHPRSQHFGRPTAFTPSNVHDDVRLALGWSSIFIAFGTAYYGYRVPFEESKFWVSIGVALSVTPSPPPLVPISPSAQADFPRHSYVVLSGIYLLYEKYVVRNIVFVGKRRTVTTRVRFLLCRVSSPPPRTRLTPSLLLPGRNRAPHNLLLNTPFPHRPQISLHLPRLPPFPLPVPLARRQSGPPLPDLRPQGRLRPVLQQRQGPHPPRREGVGQAGWGLVRQGGNDGSRGI